MRAARHGRKQQRHRTSSTRCRRAHHRHRAGSCLQTTIGQKTLRMDMSATCPTTVGALFFEERPEKPMQSAGGSGCARAAVCILARSLAKAATTLTR